MFKSVQTQSHGPSAALVDIAPLIDIVFILLIFFLVSATFVRDTGVQVTRPQATVIQALEPTSMRVSVTSGGDAYAEGRKVTLVELRAAVSEFISNRRQRGIIVIPDADVSAGRLIEVMDAARQAGATDVAIATRQREASR